MQEVEVRINLDPKLLTLKNFQFELEKNSLKARTAIYISNEVRYRRLKNLEGTDSHIVIIDTEGIKIVKRIINVYRSFNPQNNVSARAKFLYQLQHIKNIFVNIIVLKMMQNMTMAQQVSKFILKLHFQ